MKLRKRAKHLKRTQKCWIVVRDHPQWGALLERCVPGKVRPFTGPLRNINWNAFERMVLEAAWGPLLDDPFPFNLKQILDGIHEAIR